MKLVMKILALVLCLTTVVTFFIPIMKSDNEYISGKVSSYQIVFNSLENAKTKVSEATKEGKTQDVADYSMLISFKSNKDTKTKFNLIGYFHMFAAISALVASVFLVLSLFSIDYKLVQIIAVSVAFAFALAALISQIALFQTTIIESGILAKKILVDTNNNYSAGVILSFLTSFFALASAIVLNLKFKKSKKSKAK